MFAQVWGDVFEEIVVVAVSFFEELFRFKLLRWGYRKVSGLRPKGLTSLVQVPSC